VDLRHPGGVFPKDFAAIGRGGPLRTVLEF
jgi:hypothetical protein